MVQPSEQEIAGRIARLLVILGDLLRELGELVQSDRQTREVGLGERSASAESDVAPLGNERTAAPVGSGGSQSGAAEFPAEIRAAVDRGFDLLFGAEREEETAAAGVERDLDRDSAAGSDRDPVPEPLSDASLVLVLEMDGERWAIPWHRVVGARLSVTGAPETFLLDDPRHPRRLNLGQVLGMWTVGELRAEKRPLRWLEAESAPAGSGISAQEKPIPDPYITDCRCESGSAQSEDSHEVTESGPPADHPTAEPADQRAPSGPLTVCVVSPSALARRLLGRQLRDRGFEVLEARDLEDPLLPADLSGIGGLFLDESLLERWQTRQAEAKGAPALVQLVVDGALRVPPPGEYHPEGAILPRPFERTEVARVVGWLRSLQDGRQLGGSDHHGEEEDGTWIFTDPFGTQGAGEHPGR